MKGAAGLALSTMADLEHGVQVWYYRLDPGPDRVAEMLQWLDDAEAERARGFRFDMHSRRFVAGRGTLREILASYAGVGPRTVRFEYGAHGKPYIDGPECLSGLTFSVSNSGELGAVAIARGLELGLDLEQEKASADHDLVAEREFSAQEQRWYLDLSADRRPKAFFQLWTCKEAYLKGKGLGLNASLKCFSISLGSRAWPELAWSDIDLQDPRRWSFSWISTQPGYIACLALDGDRRAIHVSPWGPADLLGDPRK
jgi:4'-phosphopantetheinyl transferase